MLQPSLNEEFTPEKLDAAGIMGGVDKSSLLGNIPCSWDYLRHYEAAFSRYKDADINVIELGVASGASLDIWLRYFSKATIIGIDINPVCAQFARGRAVVKIGSQDDSLFLEQVAAEYEPTIVIDDGSHVSKHIITSFETLFPKLLPGGTYAIEDLAFHFRESGDRVISSQPHPELASEHIYDYLQKFVAAKLAHVSALPAATVALNSIYNEIDTVTAVGGLILIKKKRSRDVAQILLHLKASLKQLETAGPEQFAHGNLRVAEFMMTYGMDPAEALAFAEAGAALLPKAPNAMRLRRLALVALGRTADADGVASELLHLGETLDVPTISKPSYMAYPHR